MAKKKINNIGVWFGMSTTYDITLKTEVLLEFVAELMADCHNAMDKNNITLDDIKNPIVIIDSQVNRMKDGILLSNSMNELFVYEGKLRQCRDLLREIEH